MCHYYVILLELINLKKTKIVFYYISAIKNIIASSSSSNFPIKLVCWGIFVFVCLDKSIPISL